MSDPQQGCSMAVEDVFGIVNSSCLNGFDFTLLFEEAILTILPLGISIGWALLRLSNLRNEAPKISRSWPLAVKMSLFAAFIILQAVLLAVWSAQNIPHTRLTFACIGFSIGGFCILLVTSYFEHIYSVRPSTVLVVYLGVSTLLDLARTRTLFFLPGSHSVASILLASYLVKVLMFCAENMSWHRFSRPEWKHATPEEKAGAIDRSLFLWLNHIFIKGFKTFLTVDMLTPVDPEILSASRPLKLQQRWDNADHSSNYALFWTFLIHYKWPFLAGVLPRLAYSGFLFAQPFLVERVLDFIDEARTPTTNDTAYGLIGAYAIVYIGIAVSYAVNQHKTYRLLTMYRGSLVMMIFEKTLKMKSTSIADAEAITLMSADIDRIGHSLPLIHELWASFIDVAIACWLLYRLLGVAVVAPILWIVLCLIAGLPLAGAAGNAQTPWLEAIESRLAATAKALGSVKAIKMTGLADVVSATIRQLRLDEIRASLRWRVLNIFVTIFYFASSTFAPVWGYGVYIILARSRNTETLTDSIAFSALSLFELMNQPMIYIIDGFEHIQTVANSFRRIQEYLTSEDHHDFRITPDFKQPSDSISSNSDNTDDISLKENPASKAIAELDQHQNVASVKEVSTGYDEDTTILHDLNLDIPRGQLTMIFGPVGSGKSTLLRLLLGEMPCVSGNVATSFRKAAFCPQTPWITWGSVRSNIIGASEYDSKWYNIVIQACSLVADLDELPHGDQTNTGTRGSRLSGGQQMRVSLARALYYRSPILILDDVLTGLDRTTERAVLESVLGADGLAKKVGTTVIMTTNTASHLQFADKIVMLNEHGKIARQGTLDAISPSGDWIRKLSEQPTVTTSRPLLELSDETMQEVGVPLDGGNEPDPKKQSGDWKVYSFYVKIAGSWRMSLYVCACATFVFGVNFPSVWLQKWTNYNADHPNQEIGYYLGVYAALASIAIIGCSLADGVFNLFVIPRTSRKLHELLLTATMRAPTSFLTSTDAGVTLNRFSQDLELIDQDLPTSLDQTIFQLLSAIMSAVILFIGSGYVAIAIPLCIVVIVAIQLFYLRTSRQLRILDIEAKAPLFSQFLETLGGISSIRAFDWTSHYVESVHDSLNVSQKPYYLLWCVQRWLTMVLDLFVAGIAIILVALATNIRGSGSTGYLGVALYQVVTFSTTLQTLVTEWTQVEMALGAISRVRTYILNTKDENLPNETGLVSDKWPAKGAIVFNGVSASYDTSTDPVLKDINLSIAPGEKVAICGRTGSGKSSLVSTLLRMLELQSGSICVDDIDISTIARQAVRARFNSLPQDPFFLQGTVRENLDPLGVATDERLIQALQSVRLWDFCESRGGLDEDMNEETLSHGQRQLFCLIRAVINPSSVLIMDEVGSSVDADTDALIHEVLQKEFEACTVIAVVHKLHTTLDFDRFVVLDKGRIVEEGPPRELLERPGSLFKALYDSMQTEER
ncbi:hypothetical protein AnigIFM59636_011200 [Aspergillus niger]|uniref:P-loop containing nucleoside triphosphate hydrolase protein n=1 Tax=Aspergillus niger TaxID=5061 RepID=A0A254U3X6_ASPNG|nr:hypothetical protein CBS147323_4572 [Aspergillus niger]KAI3004148.1 hypothetical protein CBS147345_7911 [Aspergillus niger]KAI3027029.1 hypothetical protein CBS147347_4664 [Aspergillus niger]TPR09770.1 hypothetical protein CAN33_0053130 [Aspergillus niger]SPB49181.1 unnamed protein product [Aspergillus niger]